jgi:monoamine oxidase
VVVVGGGIAGLLSAYELEKRGFTVSILEADSVFGGRVATADYGGGLKAEYGLQEMWSDNPLLSTVRELGIPLDENPGKSYSSVIIDGKLYPYFRTAKEAFFDTLMPPPDKARLLSWLDQAERLRARALSEGLSAPEVRSLQDLSFSAWVESAKLPRNAAELLRLLIECEVGTTWQGVSALFGLLEFGPFLGEGELAYHVRGGNSRLIEGLLGAIHGEKLRSATVLRIERFARPDGQITVRVDYERDHRIRTLTAERVVVAVPFWRLHQIEMLPPLSADKWQAISSLSRGQYTVVHLLMKKDAEKLWLIHGESPFALLTDGPLGVVYGTFGAAPTLPATEVFSLLIHGASAAAFHMVPRELRLAEIDGNLDALWPGFSQYVQASYVFSYHPGAVPVWPPGRSPLDEPSSKLREPELGLYLAGDYLYDAHSDGAAKSALRVAEQIGAALPRLSDKAPAAPLPPRPGPRRALHRRSSREKGNG